MENTFGHGQVLDETDSGEDSEAGEERGIELSVSDEVDTPSAGRRSNSVETVAAAPSATIVQAN